MLFINHLRKSHRRKQPQPLEPPTQASARDTRATPPRRPADIDAIVRATHARRRLQDALKSGCAPIDTKPKPAAEALGAGAAAAAKPRPKAAPHTLRRTVSCVFESELEGRLALAGGHGWKRQKSYNFTLGRHIVALERHVWGVAHPVEHHVLRGPSPKHVGQALGPMEHAGWYVTDVRAPAMSEPHRGYEVQLRRQRIDELPAPPKQAMAL